jgi:GntR family transcriptional regulator
MDKIAAGHPRIRISRFSPLPLHYQISEQLRHEIGNGRYAAGQPLASESELMARFGVARGTIRQALAALRADGSIAGGRGRPPTVRGARLAQPFTELLSFSAWVSSLGRKPSGKVIEFARRPADVEVAEALGVPRGEPVFCLVRVRLADEEALMIERTVFPAAVGQLVGGLELDRQSIYAELAEQGVVFDSARQIVDAVGASPVDARLLGVPPRTPLLRVRRHSFSPDGVPLEWSEDRYLSERVVLTIDNSAARPSLSRRLASVGGR